MATPAGEGNHNVYRILPKNPSDTGKLTARNHYIGLDAVAWYINKESSWFTDRLASGTLEIKLSAGLEKYQTALGTFELKSGAKIAPVFEKAVLPDRNYRGGSITLAASLTAIKKDTVVAGLLKSASSASLGIVAGMVETATVAGPAKLLAAAGEDLINGVKRVLGDTAEKREPMFDFSGMEYTVQPEDIVGSEIYLLMHRGNPLQEAKLTVQSSGQLRMPFYDGIMLEDGAWLLLRVRRKDEYEGVREWFEDARKLRSRIKAAVDDVAAGFISKEDGLAEFKTSATGNKTLLDEFTRLRSIINNDGVLSEREAGLHVGQLYAMTVTAQKAISESNAKSLNLIMKQLTDALSKGQKIGGILGSGFEEQVANLAVYRKASLVRDTSFRRVASLSGDDLFESMKYLPKALKESAHLV